MPRYICWWHHTAASDPAPLFFLHFWGSPDLISFHERDILRLSHHSDISSSSICNMSFQISLLYGTGLFLFQTCSKRNPIFYKASLTFVEQPLSKNSYTRECVYAFTRAPYARYLLPIYLLNLIDTFIKCSVPKLGKTRRMSGNSPWNNPWNKFGTTLVVVLFSSGRGIFTLRNSFSDIHSLLPIHLITECCPPFLPAFDP